MKQFAINPCSFNDMRRTYQVCFGNRTLVEFGSKRHMAAFIADANKFLTQSMVELNQLYSSFFMEYRNTWFTLMNNKTGNKVNMKETEWKLQRINSDIMEQFNRAGNSAFANSSGVYAFMHLQNICWMLKDANDILIDLNKKRNNTIQYHNLQVINERLVTVANRLANFPEEKPANALSVRSNK